MVRKAKERASFPPNTPKGDLQESWMQAYKEANLGTCVGKLSTTWVEVATPAAPHSGIVWCIRLSRYPTPPSEIMHRGDMLTRSR